MRPTTPREGSCTSLTTSMLGTCLPTLHQPEARSRASRLAATSCPVLTATATSSFTSFHASSARPDASEGGADGHLARARATASRSGGIADEDAEEEEEEEEEEKEEDEDDEDDGAVDREIGKEGRRCEASRSTTSRTAAAGSAYARDGRRETRGCRAEGKGAEKKRLRSEMERRWRRKRNSLYAEKRDMGCGGGDGWRRWMAVMDGGDGWRRWMATMAEAGPDRGIARARAGRRGGGGRCGRMGVGTGRVAERNAERQGGADGDAHHSNARPVSNARSLARTRVHVCVSLCLCPAALLAMASQPRHKERAAVARAIVPGELTARPLRSARRLDAPRFRSSAYRNRRA